MSKSDSGIRPESSLHIGKYSYIQSGINNKSLQEYFVLVLGSTKEKAVFYARGLQYLSIVGMSTIHLYEQKNYQYQSVM